MRAGAGMHLARAVRGLGPVDVRGVVRDPMLRWLALLPPLLALLVRWGLPALEERLVARLGLDLVPYHPLIASFLALLSPMLAGVLVGFLLLDERDDGTLAALQVTPLSLSGLVAYRIAAPLALGVVLTLVVVPLSGLVAIRPLALLLVALVAAPLAPMLALFLAAFAGDKVQGFALMKAAGVVNWPPVVAWFLPVVWQWVTGIVPTYWPAKLFWMLEAGEPGWAGYLLVGVVYQALLVRWLAGQFRRVAGQ